MGPLALSSTIKHTPASSTTLKGTLSLLNNQTRTTTTTTIRPREKPPVNREELDIKLKGSVRGDGRGDTRGSVSHIGGDFQAGSLSKSETQQTVVPSLDNVAHSDLEFEKGLSLARAIENAPVIEGSSVVNTEGVSLLGLVHPITSFEISFFHDLVFLLFKEKRRKRM